MKNEITEKFMLGLYRRRACAAKDLEKLTLQLGRALSTFFRGAKSRHDMKRLSMYAIDFKMNLAILKECIAVADGECLPAFAIYGHQYPGMRACRRVYLGNLRLQERFQKSGIIWVDPLTKAESVLFLEDITSKQVVQLFAPDHVRTVEEQIEWLIRREQKRVEIPVNKPHTLKIVGDRIVLPRNYITIKQFIAVAPRVMTVEQAMHVVQQIIADQKGKAAA